LLTINYNQIYDCRTNSLQVICTAVVHIAIAYAKADVISQDNVCSDAPRVDLMEFTAE